MTETRTIRDPFLNKQVEISSKLVDRLRGKYACGPTLQNGEPEFGWRQTPTPPIQHEAAAEIERLRQHCAALEDAINAKASELYPDLRAERRSDERFTWIVITSLVIGIISMVMVMSS